MAKKRTMTLGRAGLIFCLCLLLTPIIGSADSTLTGDVNLDEKITTTDVLQLKQHIVQTRTLTGQALINADINADGKITSTDLLKLKRLLVGLDSTETEDSDSSNSITKTHQNIKVEYNTVSSRYTIGSGKEMGFVLILPDNHPAMNIQICSAAGDLYLDMYGYDEEFLWGSGSSAGEWFKITSIAVVDGSIASFYCGADVKYILVYHNIHFGEDGKKITTATFWYQGALVTSSLSQVTTSLGSSWQNLGSTAYIQRILDVPISLVTIESEAFMGSSFTTVRLSEKTRYIHSRAFADCPNLMKVFIYNANCIIAEDAFQGVKGLTIYGEEGSTAEAYANRQGYAFEIVK